MEPLTLTVKGEPITPSQLAHARAMVSYVAEQKLPERAAVIMIETAIVESRIQIYSNPAVPESMSIPHEAVGYDHLSVGVLQQQVPSWGTAADCMDPVRAAAKFIHGAGVNPGLLTLPSYRFAYVGYPNATRWDQIPTGSAAQAVQVSAVPDAYAQWEHEATAIVAALWNEDDMSEPKDWSKESWAAMDAHLDHVLDQKFKNWANGHELQTALKNQTESIVGKLNTAVEKILTVVRNRT